MALISDTGMRLAEAAGWCSTSSSMPTCLTLSFANTRVTLKTKRQRDIPLAGMSLWAARRIVEKQQDFAFPRYTDGSGCNANSASATINKWLKPRVPDGCVVHSSVTAFATDYDVECPSDIADAIGGWATAGVGQKYGSGYGLESKPGG